MIKKRIIGIITAGLMLLSVVPVNAMEQTPNTVVEAIETSDTNTIGRNDNIEIREVNKNQTVLSATTSSGTSGGCSWDITDGVLTIQPQNASSATLEDWGFNAPWSDHITDVTKIVIKPGVKALTCSNMFNFAFNVQAIEGLENLDTSDVTNMDNMFYGCENLISINLENFNTTKVENMNSMFEDCSILTSIDLSDFDTTNVTDMSYMFAGCKNLTSINLESFDTAKVDNMHSMFSNCSSLTSLDLSSLDTSNVEYMSNMFKKCTSLSNINLQDIETGNVQNMNSMFEKCSSLTSLDLSDFNTSNVIEMERMFRNCSGLTSIDLSSLNTSNVAITYGMFEGCSSLTSLDLSGFETNNLQFIDNMFSDCTNLAKIDFTGFKTDNVTSMFCLFNNCSSLESVDLSGFNTENVMDMEYMFDGCSSLTSLDLSSFNTLNVGTGAKEYPGSMNYMFNACNSLETLILGKDFKFADSQGNEDNAGSVLLPEAKSGYRWQEIGTGTKDAPKGSILTKAEDIREYQNNSDKANTYIQTPIKIEIAALSDNAAKAEATLIGIEENTLPVGGLFLKVSEPEITGNAQTAYNHANDNAKNVVAFFEIKLVDKDGNEVQIPQDGKLNIRLSIGGEFKNTKVNIGHYSSNDGSFIALYEDIVVDDEGYIEFQVGRLSYFAIQKADEEIVADKEETTEDTTTTQTTVQPEDTNSTIVNTGDSSKMFLLLGIVGVAFVGLCAIVVVKSKNEMK